MLELFDVDGGSLERFLRRWCGPPDRDPVSARVDALPRPLREWFELTSRWSTPIATQNQMLRQPSADAGKLVFWVENQGVWLWATTADGDDPPVYDRENEVGVAWEPTGESLSAFLLHATVFEAIWSSRHAAAAAWVTPGQLDEILAPLRPLPMPEWRWLTAGHLLYAADGLLAFAGPNPGPGETADMREVFVAADGPGRLAYLTGVANVEWDAFTV